MLRLNATAAAFLLATVAAHAAAESYTAFDLPKPARYISHASINAAGSAAGTYVDTNGLSRGFLRTSTGTVTAIDIPGATGGTYVAGITADGTVIGYWSDSAGAHGFARAADGTLAPYNIPGSASTKPGAVNSLGGVAGTFAPTPPQTASAFVASADGTLATFGAASPIIVTPGAINDGDDVAGSSYQSFNSDGFLRTSDGAYATFSVPLPPRTAGPDKVTNVTGINNSRAITGTAQYVLCSEVCVYGATSGFVRTADGSVSVFKVPGGTTGTSPSGINAAGVVVGTSTVSSKEAHGFLRDPDGTLTTLDVPRMRSTSAAAINDAGVVVGHFVDLRNNVRGYIRKP